jgi:flagellar hook-basal body complex protein FliE
MTDPLGLINTAAANSPGVQGLRPGASAGAGGDNAAAGPSFKDVLMKNLEEVNQAQQDAQHAVEDLHAGRQDLDHVLLAQQKADLAFQLLVQVRNKMIDAYDEIKNVRV